MLTEAKLNTANALAFVLAGNATFTLRSMKTQARYTYKVRMGEAKPGMPQAWFVKLLSGPDNEGDYQYLGMVTGGKFKTTKASKMNAESTPVKAFMWFFTRLQTGATLDNLEVWHAGKCGRCGRTLTVPESIEQGYGPECIGKVAA